MEGRLNEAQLGKTGGGLFEMYRHNVHLKQPTLRKCMTRRWSCQTMNGS